ncbi:MAG: integrase, partial [Deltaproteobacteria bacterium]
MVIQMDEKSIKTLADVEAFLAGADKAGLKLSGSKDDIYAWVERTLNRFRYGRLSKKEKSVVRSYLIQLSGHSRQQITRMITRHRETGYVRRRQRTTNGFLCKYTREDKMLLAEVDQLVDSSSGTTVRIYCQRASEQFGDPRFERLAYISVSHLYNLRGSKV